MLNEINLGHYLQELRLAQHLSLRKVNALTGISYSHLSMIEHGTRKVTPSLLQSLASLYQIDCLDLYEKAGYLKDQNKKVEIQSTHIPLIENIDSLWKESSLNKASSTITISQELSKQGDFFAIPIVDDSMYPAIWKNDIAIIQKETNFQNGNIVLVGLPDHSIRLRKLKELKENLLFQPLNTNYEPTLYSISLKSTIPIFGILKELQRTF